MQNTESQNVTHIIFRDIVRGIFLNKQIISLYFANPLSLSKLYEYPIPILNTLSWVLGFCSPKVTRRATVVLQMNRETASIIPRSRDYAVIKNNNICRSPVREGGRELQPPWNLREIDKLTDTLMMLASDRQTDFYTVVIK